MILILTAVISNKMTTSDNTHMFLFEGETIKISPTLLLDGDQSITPAVCKNLGDIIMEFAIQSYDIKFCDPTSQNEHDSILYFLQHFEPYFNHIFQSLKAGSLKYDPVFQLVENSDQRVAFRYRINNFLTTSSSMCDSNLRKAPTPADQKAKRQCIRSD
jgi:hypothetical protein